VSVNRGESTQYDYGPEETRARNSRQGGRGFHGKAMQACPEGDASCFGTHAHCKLLTWMPVFWSLDSCAVPACSVGYVAGPQDTCTRPTAIFLCGSLLGLPGMGHDLSPCREPSPTTGQCRISVDLITGPYIWQLDPTLAPSPSPLASQATSSGRA